jgi:hypothetical protein
MGKCIVAVQPLRGVRGAMAYSAGCVKNQVHTLYLQENERGRNIREEELRAVDGSFWWLGVRNAAAEALPRRCARRTWTQSMGTSAVPYAVFHAVRIDSMIVETKARLHVLSASCLAGSRSSNLAASSTECAEAAFLMPPREDPSCVRRSRIVKFP